jgi:hypothetical protein
MRQRPATTMDDMPEDWLATVIRKALQALVGDTEPSLENWARIRQNIEARALPVTLVGGKPVMLSYKDPLVQQEHYKDLLQEAEHERLIQAAGFQQPGNWRLHRKVAGWIGAQMVRWGGKLQSYATTPPPHCLQGASDR